jgi:hypothetical protein
MLSASLKGVKKAAFIALHLAHNFSQKKILNQLHMSSLSSRTVSYLFED